MSIKIRMERELDAGFVSDVLITAFDGGYGGSWYWAQPKRGTAMDSPHWLQIENAPEKEEIDRLWLSCRITVNEDEHDDGWTENKILREFVRDGVKVDAECIRSGIQSLWDRNYDDENFRAGILEADAGCIDANLADTIVQEGVFGYQIFG